MPLHASVGVRGGGRREHLSTASQVSRGADQPEGVFALAAGGLTWRLAGESDPEEAACT